MTERGRRTSRPSGDERQEAILRTTEELLAGSDLDALSISEIARGAGLSRPTFYFYFASKDDVLLALLDRVIGQVERCVASLPQDPAAGPEATWRPVIAAFVEGFAEHRAVAAAALRHTSPQVRELWSHSMTSWVDHTARVVDAERARGAAPAGVDAHDLAVALNLMNERVLGAAFTDERPAVRPEAALDVLVGIWLRAIYAPAPEPSTPPTKESA